jgi:hypothetical protein
MRPAAELRRVRRGLGRARTKTEEIMGDRDILDDRDEDARDDAAIVRRLNRVLTIVQKANARLTAISAVSISPGPPDGPALCDSIVAEAGNTVTLASEIKAKFLRG